MSRAAGIGHEDLAALAEPAGNGCFSDREKAALAYAAAITREDVVEERIFREVWRHFSEEEIIELTATITFEICAAKFNRALEIEWGSCLYQPPPELKRA